MRWQPARASYPITVIFMAFAVGSLTWGRRGGVRLWRKGHWENESAVSTLHSLLRSLSLITAVLGYVYCGSMMRLIYPVNIFGDGGAVP